MERVTVVKGSGYNISSLSESDPKILNILIKYLNKKHFILGDVSSRRFINFLLKHQIFLIMVTDPILQIDETINYHDLYLTSNEIKICHSTGFSTLILDQNHLSVVRQKFRKLLIDKYRQDSKIWKIILTVQYYGRGLKKNIDPIQPIVDNIIKEGFHIYNKLLIKKGLSYLLEVIEKDPDFRIRTHLSVAIKQVADLTCYLEDPIAIALFDPEKDFLSFLSSSTIRYLTSLSVIHFDRESLINKLELLFLGRTSVFRVRNETAYQAGRHGTYRADKIAVGQLQDYQLFTRTEIINNLRKFGSRYYLNNGPTRIELNNQIMEDLWCYIKYSW